MSPSPYGAFLKQATVPGTRGSNVPNEVLMTVCDRTILTALCIFTFACFAAGSAGAAEPDWPALADAETVYVLTTDEDGDTRETKIWMRVIDGTPYIRTSRNSHWGDNVERQPEIALRVEEDEYPLRAQFIEGDDERARIVAAFEEKYGSNPILNWIRGDDPRIMRLDPR
jgi:hypothetical protein